jgi:predicted regulator of Ras-like GTPase activity (Roadblock/LC7/MglB family)
MASTVETLKKLDGFIAAALVDSSSGMMLESTVVGTFPVEIAAAANTEVLQAKLKAMDAIGLGDDMIEDILISLGTQYHLLRPLASNREIFIYIALDRSRANLAMARIELKKVEGSIKRI